MKKRIEITTSETGYECGATTISEAKKIAKEMYNKGLNPHIYVDYFDNEELIDPVKTITYDIENGKFIKK